VDCGKRGAPDHVAGTEKDVGPQEGHICERIQRTPEASEAKEKHEGVEDKVGRELGKVRASAMDALVVGLLPIPPASTLCERRAEVERPLFK